MSNDYELRQLLVTHALQGLCANPKIVEGLEVDAESVARLAVQMADKLLDAQLSPQQRWMRDFEAQRKSGKATTR